MNAEKARRLGAKPKYEVLYPKVAERIRKDELRYVDIAQMAGCKPETVAHVLTGRRKLTRTTAIKIAKAFGENYLDLFGEIEDRRDTECRLREKSRSGGNAT